MLSKEQIDAVFSRYLRGEWPTDEEVAKAPRISNWRVVVLGSVHEMRLQGTVTGHPGLPDGDATTSPLIWIDKTRRLAYTLSRLYSLGDPTPEPSR